MRPAAACHIDETAFVPDGDVGGAEQCQKAGNTDVAGNVEKPEIETGGSDALDETIQRCIAEPLGSNALSVTALRP